MPTPIDREEVQQSGHRCGPRHIKRPQLRAQARPDGLLLRVERSTRGRPQMIDTRDDEAVREPRSRRLAQERVEISLPDSGWPQGAASSNPAPSGWTTRPVEFAMLRPSTAFAHWCTTRLRTNLIAATKSSLCGGASSSRTPAQFNASNSGMNSRSGESGCCDASLNRSCAFAYPATSQSRGTDVTTPWLNTGVAASGGPPGPNGGMNGGPVTAVMFAAETDNV